MSTVEFHIEICHCSILTFILLQLFRDTVQLVNLAIDIKITQIKYANILHAFSGHMWIHHQAPLFLSATISGYNMVVLCDVSSAYTGSPLIGIAAFVLVNLPFAFLDLTGRPRALLKYKIQEEKPVPVSVHSYLNGLSAHQ